MLLTLLVVLRGITGDIVAQCTLRFAFLWPIITHLEPPSGRSEELIQWDRTADRRLGSLARHAPGRLWGTLDARVHAPEIPRLRFRLGMQWLSMCLNCRPTNGATVPSGCLRPASSWLPVKNRNLLGTCFMTLAFFRLLIYIPGTCRCGSMRSEKEQDNSTRPARSVSQDHSPTAPVDTCCMPLHLCARQTLPHR